MVRIMGYEKGSLPTLERLLETLPAQWLAAWRARHGEMRGESRARESLAALELLYRMHPTGTLAYDEKGRPRFLEGDADLSITHTHGAVFCAVSDGDSRIGLDAEHLSRLSTLNANALAERFFTAAERELLSTATDDSLFLRIWTRKEALVKQSGIGLSGLSAADSTATDAHFFEARVGEVLLTLAYSGEEVLVGEMKNE